MSKRVFVEILTTALHHGRFLTAGDVVELHEADATSLIAIGAAKVTTASEEPVVVDTPTSTEESSSELIDTEAVKAAQEADERDNIYKTIYARYVDKDLRRLAKEHNVEFPYDAKKHDVVIAIIDQEKHEIFLRVVEE